MTDGDGVSVGDLPGLKRRQLMDMAKARGIRANQKTTINSVRTNYIHCR